MADIKYIKDLSDKKGLSLREISRTTGFNFRTVQKYLDQEDWSQPVAGKKAIHTVIDPFRNQLMNGLRQISMPQENRDIQLREYTIA